MKKSLLFLLLLLIPSAGRLLYAQVYEEDYKFPAKGNHYWTDHDVRNFCWTGMAGDMTLYTDDIYNCHAPLTIELISRKYANATVYDYSFYTDITNDSERTFKKYCEWWGYGLGSYWEYRALHTRLINCKLGTYLKVQHIMPNYASNIFMDLKSLVGAEVEFASAITDVGIRTVRDGMFIGCGNLKFVTFSTPSSENSELYYADDRSPIYMHYVFLACTSLEVVRFKHEAPNLNESRHAAFTEIFRANLDNTIYNSPNMKAFVVPAYDIENWTEVLKKTHKGVLEGWVKVIPDALFTSPKPQGVTLNSTAVHLLSVSSTYQLTATVAPSNVYNKNVIWSSSDPAVATVSSTGLVTAKNAGVVTIKATLAMDTNFWAASTVVVRPDYVHLKTLSVAGYPFSGGFNANTVSYSLTVPFSTSSINISAEANNYPGVTVTGAGTKTLPVGDISFPITVNSSLIEHVSKTYTISIHRKSNDAAFKSLTAGGAALPLDRFVHNITVPNATGTFNISAAANHSLASVSGTGNKTLNIGDNNPFTVTVTAEDGNKITHTINVHRKSNDATFKSFTLTGNSGDIPFGFNPATLNYTVPVSNSVTGATVAAVANHPLATVTGNESKTLNVGDNTFTVTITPEEGLPKTYTINVHRKSTDNSFKSFTLTGNSGDIPFGFNPATFTYAVTVSYSVTGVTVAAAANYPLATVTGTESKALNEGDNTFTVTITPEEGQPKTYTINVYRKSGDATLQSVMLDGLIAFDIDPLSDYYTIPVGENIRRVTMQVTPKSSFATVTGDHSQPLRLNIGDNIFKVAVTAEDTIYQKTYTFNIQRNDVYLRGVTLRASVWEGTRPVDSILPLPFDPSILDYNMDVSCLTAGVEIIADAEFPEYVTGTGAFPLEYGENVFNIHLNNNYDREKTYTLKINSTSKNPHNQLQSLNCRPYSISPAYSLDIYNYTLNVEKTVESIHIDAVPVPPATVSGQTGTQRLNYGRNLFTFTVTATNDETSTYTLDVWREPLNTDAALSYFAVTPGHLSPSFTPEITSYTAEVESSVEEVIIDALLRSPTTAKFTPGYAKPGTYPVKTGKNWFRFNISAEDSLSTNRYTLTVTRKGNTTNTARITRNIPAVGIRNGTIEINTPAAERISIYSVTGTLLYSFDKPAGAFTFHPSPFTLSPFHPSPILIVKGSSGWSEKVINY